MKSKSSVLYFSLHKEVAFYSVLAFINCRKPLDALPSRLSFLIAFIPSKFMRNSSSTYIMETSTGNVYEK